MSRDDALIYGTAICLMTIVPGIASSHSLFRVFHNGTKVRVAVCSLIYRKVCINSFDKRFKCVKVLPILCIASHRIRLFVIYRSIWKRKQRIECDVFAFEMRERIQQCLHMRRNIRYYDAINTPNWYHK